MVALPLSSDICVIGAGAAGLCTARHLLRCGFRPFLLEKANVVGGLWHADSHRTWPNLTTNLSKFSCCFSDFPWPSVSSKTSSSTANPAIFPTNFQVQEYLQAYADRYILNDHPEHVRFGCTVTKVKRDETSTKYHVEWTESAFSGSSAQQEYQHKQQLFDGVVITSGFYSKPLWPTSTSLSAKPESTSFQNNNDEADDWVKRHMAGFQGRVLHSVQYGQPQAFRSRTVAVCGASFSAMELCADIARHAQPVKIINILPRIPYILPRWLVRSDSSLWPIDLVMYQRNDNGVAPKPDQSLVKDEAAHRAKHDILRRLVASQRQESILGLPDPTQPATVSITDHYLELVASGHIDVVHGRLVGSGDNNTLVLDNGERVDDVDDLICCTGFGPDLNYLDPSILETLEWNEQDRFAPLSLAYEAVHPKLPGLAFCGMHRGQYFGYMELQARVIAEMWSGGTRIDANVLDKALQTSQQIRQQQKRPQFPRGDYIGYMDSLASLVNLAPTDFGQKGMVALPVVYQPDRNIAIAALKDIDHQVSEQQESQMSKLALTALIGKWDFFRTISHFPQEDVAGTTVVRQETVSGQIRFTPRDLPSGTVMYREDGIFKMGRLEMEVFREYEYVHNPAASALEVYFIEGGKRAHLFLSLRFQKQSKDGGGVWLASSDHLCVKDLYKGSFTMEWKAMDLTRVVMKYRVQGPEKNYEAVTELLPGQ